MSFWIWVFFFVFYIDNQLFEYYFIKNTTK